MHFRPRTCRERGEAKYQRFTRVGLASNHDIDGASFRRNADRSLTLIGIKGHFPIGFAPEQGVCLIPDVVGETGFAGCGIDEKV